MAEQRYEAVRAVIADGATVTEVASRFGVSRKTVHAWLAKYEAGGLEGLADRSHRPWTCPHQMPPEVEVALADLRLAHPSWGPRGLVFELAKAGVAAGEWAVEDRPLRHAPHTASCVIGEWTLPYPPRLGAYSTGESRDKVWAPVRRIEGAFSDRNLVCSCPSPEAFAEA